jgi:hypothetical protein
MEPKVCILSVWRGIVKTAHLVVASSTLFADTETPRKCKKRYEVMTLKVLIDRLVARNIFWLAFLICDYLKLADPAATNRVLVHWAASMVSESAADDTIARTIIDKIGDRFGISCVATRAAASCVVVGLYGRVVAYSCGRLLVVAYSCGHLLVCSAVRLFIFSCCLVALWSYGHMVCVLVLFACLVVYFHVRVR